MIRSEVLVVEVVGVLPHIDGQERGLPVNQRVVGIAGLGDLELAFVEYEPGISAAELRDACVLQILEKLRCTAQVELIFAPTSPVGLPPPPGLRHCQ